MSPNTLLDGMNWTAIYLRVTVFVGVQLRQGPIAAGRKVSADVMIISNSSEANVALSNLAALKTLAGSVALPNTRFKGCQVEPAVESGSAFFRTSAPREGVHPLSGSGCIGRWWLGLGCSSPVFACAAPLTALDCGADGSVAAATLLLGIEVPPESCMVLARSIASTVDAQFVLLTTDIPAHVCSGATEAGTEDAFFAVHSRAASSKVVKHRFTPLPVGDMVTGASAAIFCCCEVRNCVALKVLNELSSRGRRTCALCMFLPNSNLVQARQQAAMLLAKVDAQPGVSRASVQEWGSAVQAALEGQGLLQVAALLDVPTHAASAAKGLRPINAALQDVYL